MLLSSELFVRDAVLELSERAAELAPQSFNSDAFTCEVVFSSGAGVERSDRLGRYLEILDMSPASVDLGAFVGGPVLDGHQRASARSVYGMVSAARIENGRGLATVQLSRAADAAPLVDRIREGTVRSVSIGYEVLSTREERGANGERTLVATRWRPRELSFVPIGADPHARIRTLATSMGLTPEFAEGLVTRSLTVEAARGEILAELQRQAPRIHPTSPAMVTRDVGEGLVDRIADGLYARMNPAHQATSGRPYAYMRLPEVARLVLDSRGLNSLGSPAELLTRAMHTTSDFPGILATVFNKNLLTVTRTPSPITQVFRTSTVADFRPKNFYDISDGPTLQRVNEAGEIPFGSISDKTVASYSAASYARGFSVSFQTLTNDDMGALQDLSAKMTRGARSWYEGFLVNTIISNPKLADNLPVFDPGHKNVAATGAPPSDTSIAEGKLGMRLQTDLAGAPLNLMPRYILIPAALENTVDQLLASLYPAQPTEAQVAIRTLTPIVDSRLDQAGATKAWYLFASPDVAATFEVSDLEGFPGPQVQSELGFHSLGVEVRVVWHVGAGPVDSRGAWKNAGQ